MKKPEWLENINFHPVIELPEQYHVHDFTQGQDAFLADGRYSVGRYNEKRKNLYTSPLFLNEKRFIHMGIDIAAPANEKVFNFFRGEVLFYANNAGDGDYGPTIVLKHTIKKQNLFSLYGHLSVDSIENIKVGQIFETGEVLATLGDKDCNGGWTPHLHFQLSLLRPNSANMPGVVAEKDHKRALEIYPDPRWVLGPLY